MLGVIALNKNVWWYIARSSGLVAWILVSASVLWGLIYAGRLTRRVVPPAWNLDVHRFLGGLSVSFVIIHVVGLSADKYVNFGLSQIFIPFASTWRPGAVAWGITGLYLLIAVEATSLAMRRLPRKLWRKVHLLSFVLFVTSTVHAWQTGTDVRNHAVRWVGLGMTLAAMCTAVLRIIWAKRRKAAKSAQAAGPALSAAPATPVEPVEAELVPAAPTHRAASPDRVRPPRRLWPEVEPVAPRAARPCRVTTPATPSPAPAGRPRVPRDFFAPTPSSDRK